MDTQKETAPSVNIWQGAVCSLFIVSDVVFAGR